MGESKLIFEELNTVLCQIEACLYSRPLFHLNTRDDDGIEALTPGHFLIGQPSKALPDRNYEDTKPSLNEEVEPLSGLDTETSGPDGLMSTSLRCFVS